jgi:hypothetical protein
VSTDNFCVVQHTICVNRPLFATLSLSEPSLQFCDCGLQRERCKIKEAAQIFGATLSTVKATHYKTVAKNLLAYILEYSLQTHVVTL